MTRGALIASLVAAATLGCASDSAEPACEPVELVVRDGLSIDAAREAHEWAALRRSLRFEEARSPGHVLRMTRERTASAELCLVDLYTAGKILFEHEIGRADGLGNELSETLQANPFRRVQEGRFGGPETTTCRSCHWRGGPAGAGALADDALLLGDGDHTSSADARNPPALSGTGVIQRLAEEMTGELARIRDEAVREARDRDAEVARTLVARGVGYGTIRVSADGVIDTSGVVGVDADLVVRPFGWKGNFATIREISTAAFQAHLGLQADEIVAEHAGDTAFLGDGPVADPDADGFTSELSSRQIDALVTFIAAQATPIVRPHERVDGLGPSGEGLLAPIVHVYVDEWARGREIFETIGCATCHVPSLVLEDPVFRSGAATIDLAEEAEHPRITPDEAYDGYRVFLFSDLRRHDMGEENASLHEDRGVAPRMWLTRPLWGLASSSPWMHDGTAPTVDAAIARHGGEGAGARAAFDALDYAAKGELRVFLMSLRREWRPQVP